MGTDFIFGKNVASQAARVSLIDSGFDCIPCQCINFYSECCCTGLVIQKGKQIVIGCAGCGGVSTAVGGSGVVGVDPVCRSILRKRLQGRTGINPGCSKMKQFGQDSAGEARKDGMRMREME